MNSPRVSARRSTPRSCSISKAQPISPHSPAWTTPRPPALKCPSTFKPTDSHSATGSIHGSITTNGHYDVTLRVKNALGTDEKPLHIVVGEEISLTPPMGWNSWNCWAEAVDADKVMRSARAMASSGLIQHGWTY